MTTQMKNMKCYKTTRCLLLTLCTLQMISTAERQLFDFLGRLWLPILLNFFNFIFVILGFYGSYQYKTNYLVVYLSWMVLWLAWNIFVICFYLNVGVLSNQSDALNFGTGSASWWEINGIGCEPVYPTNLTLIDISRPLRPEVVKGCLLNYEYVETIHAAFQCCFAIFSICITIYLIKVFLGKDDDCKKKPASIYYVEYSSPNRDRSESPDLVLDNPHQQPMTPRKVKRQNRHRSSGRSQGRNRSSQRTNTHNSRNSQRNHRRPQYLNPVTKLIDKANEESSTSTDSFRHAPEPLTFGGGRQGHSNPMYVHSRPNSTYSLNEDPPERPPSVHSSYSNYHGQRPSLNPNGTTTFGQRNGTLGGVTHRNGPRKSAVEGRSTFKPHGLFTSGPNSSASTLKGSTYSGDTFSDGERPPPYMFGISSETVI